MSLEKRIEEEFKEALKAREEIKVSTLRMVKAALNNLKLDKNIKELSEDDMLGIVQRQVKQHRESIDQFKKGNRQDLVDKEPKELEILLKYIPEQIPMDELEKIVKETVKELGATTKKDIGNVMRTVMGKVKGKAEGKMVSQIASKLLA